MESLLIPTVHVPVLNWTHTKTRKLLTPKLIYKSSSTSELRIQQPTHHHKAALWQLPIGRGSCLQLHQSASSSVFTIAILGFQPLTGLSVRPEHRLAFPGAIVRWAASFASHRPPDKFLDPLLVLQLRKGIMKKCILLSITFFFIVYSFHCRTLSGRTIFITGASRGIGEAIALRCAQDGANIVIAAKTAEPHPKLPGTIYTVARESMYDLILMHISFSLEVKLLQTCSVRIRYLPSAMSHIDAQTLMIRIINSETIFINIYWQ